MAYVDDIADTSHSSTSSSHLIASPCMLSRNLKFRFLVFTLNFSCISCSCSCALYKTKLHDISFCLALVPKKLQLLAFYLVSYVQATYVIQ